MFLKFKQGAGNRPVYIHIDDIAAVEPNTIGSAIYLRGRDTKPFAVYGEPDDIIAAMRASVRDLSSGKEESAQSKPKSAQLALVPAAKKA